MIHPLTTEEIHVVLDGLTEDDMARARASLARDAARRQHGPAAAQPGHHHTRSEEHNVTAARFRKLPVEIDAIQLTRETFRAAVRFVPIDQFGGASETDDGSVYVDIRTLEGTMRATEGDWIIRGIKGEHYACRDDIFRATYEAVTP